MSVVEYTEGLAVDLNDDKAAKAAKIRLQRRVLKVLYFVQTGAAAGMIKFLPVYFAEHVGLSATR